MPSACEIAEERFAKGEITEDEFDRLIKKLGQTQTTVENQVHSQNTQPVQNDTVVGTTNQQEFTLTKSGWGYWLIPMIFIVPFRITQPSVENMGAGIQVVTYAALFCMVVGVVKNMFGK